MLCHQCGSPVSSSDSTCPNCQAELKRDARSASLRADGLKRMTRQLRAVQVEARFFPVNEVVSERFTLGELIGKGEFGEVFRARDTLIDSEVALKIFAPELIANPQDQEQFLKATQAARALTQPNVVRIHSGGVHKDHAWISMQTLEGLSLRKLMKMRRQRREPLPLEEIEPLIAQIALAVGHVQREFPVGNLKPENIILMPDLLKITDHYLLAAFGAGPLAERAGQLKYVAPELRGLAGERVGYREVDPRCDVYSLGAILGEMVFGPDYVPGASAEPTNRVDALCRRACATNPAERHETIEELSEEFSTLVATGGLTVGDALENAQTQIVRRPEPPAPSAAQKSTAPPAPPAISGPPAAPSAAQQSAAPSAAQQSAAPSAAQKPAAPSAAQKPAASSAAQGSVAQESAASMPPDLAPTIESPRDTSPPPAPLEEEATREFVREDVADYLQAGYDDPELGDLLATNEVQRGRRTMQGMMAAGMPALPPSPKKPGAPGGDADPADADRSGSTDKDAAMAVLVPPTPADREPTSTAIKPAADIGQAGRAGGGISPMMIIIALVLLGLVVGAVVVLTNTGEPERIKLDDLDEVASKAKTAANPADEADKADEETLAAQKRAAEQAAAVKEEAAEQVAALDAAGQNDEEAQKSGDKSDSAEADQKEDKTGEAALAAAEQAKTSGARADSDKEKGARDAQQDAPAKSGAAAAPSSAVASAQSPTQSADSNDKKTEQKKAEDKKAEDTKSRDQKASKSAEKPKSEEIAAGGTSCKSGTLLIKGKEGNYCIDAYEYPGKGSKPTTNITWFKAKQLCEGRGQRLCGLSEWRQACGGKYPYGSTWDADRCNTVDEDDFERSLAPAGSFSGCRSSSGAYDMTGNAHEWVVEQRIAGGGFDSGPDVATCGYSSPKAAGSAGGNIGFRCCVDAE